MLLLEGLFVQQRFLLRYRRRNRLYLFQLLLKRLRASLLLLEFLIQLAKLLLEFIQLPIVLLCYALLS